VEKFLDTDAVAQNCFVTDSADASAHHIAFRIKNLTKRNAYLEARGHKLLQRGAVDGATGRYDYYDTEPQLGVLIELLERNSEMEPQP
jgi:4-hydroxyphenylpyruvate dioxygenase-like putative hemolysin